MTVRPEKQVKKRFQFTPTPLILITFLLILGVLGAFRASISHAELKAWPEQTKVTSRFFELDGKQYSKAEIIDNFLNVAFSVKSWTIDDGSDDSRIAPPPDRGVAAYDIKLKYYPWLAEFIFRTKGIPDTSVLHKWAQKNVYIGYDWPRYSQSKAISDGTLYEDEATKVKFRCSYHTNWCAAQLKFVDGEYKEVFDHIKIVSLELEKITGLNLNFRLPEDAQELTENYARIRIVPVRNNRQKNFFKIYRWGRWISTEQWDLAKSEHEIQGVISFTTDIRSQVDGYLIPDGDNSLGMSICKIMPVVGVKMMKALISECLVRSLGLTDISPQENGSLISNWNKIYDPYSKLQDLDGREVAVVSPMNKSALSEVDFPKLGTEHLKDSISAYDRFMLKILYCSELKPGMTKREVKHILSSTETCF